ncbi:MAG: hypothetical protein WD826_08290, partial [Actinomycetota bacterium]
EAQDLSPMQWRMIGRRIPNRSMTILGDLGQATSAWAADSWEDALEQLGKATPVEQRELTINYRTPAEVMDAASELAQTPRGPAAAERAKQALGWLIFDTKVGPVLFHNGGTGGFRSCLVAHAPSRTAVVALCNNKDDMDPPSFSVLAAVIGSGVKESD